MKRLISLFLSLTLLCGVLALPVFAESNFVDVPEDAWYAESVEYAAANDLFCGVGGQRFAPNEPMTRAMVVMVLWRHAGKPVWDYEGKTVYEFFDVKDEAWYADAVHWAHNNMIVYGVIAPTETEEGTYLYYADFLPERPVTRQELATILYRYAGYCGLSVEARAKLDDFADKAEVDGWAQNAVEWCVAEGYLRGSKEQGGLYLAPKNSATRAEVAAVLMRFCSAVG